MTVSELIEKLQKYSPNDYVFIEGITLNNDKIDFEIKELKKPLCKDYINIICREM